MKKITKKKPVTKISKQISNPIKVVSRRVIHVDDLIPSSCTALNLECSGKYQGAFKKGSVVNIIGDSHAGKSLLSLSILAECASLPALDDYDLDYDDVEDSNEFDVPFLFGKKASDRINTDHKSRTFEQFEANFVRKLEDNVKMVYIIDSFDGLTTNAALKLDKKNRAAREKGNQEDGSYGDGKAKLLSEFFSKHNQTIKNSGSVLIIISQVRETIGFGAKFNPKRRNGGKSLKFYSQFEIWLAMKNKIKTGTRTQITNVLAKLTKNKLTGRHGEAIFPILFDYGIDDIASCINLLATEGDQTTKWTGTKASLNTKGFLTGTDAKGKVKHPKYDEIVKYIEENNLEDEIGQLCQDAYDISIEALRTDRKKKY